MSEMSFLWGNAIFSKKYNVIYYFIKIIFGRIEKEREERQKI